MANAITVPNVLEMLVGERLDLSVDFTNLIAAGDVIFIGYEGTVMGNQPTGNWRLGETSGNTAFDLYSGTPHNGVLNGTYTQGQTGPIINDSTKATLFDGITGLATISASAIDVSGNHQFSYETWINPTIVDTSFRRVCGREPVINHGAALYWQSTIGWGFLRGDSSAVADTATGGTATVGTYSHVVGTYDGTNMKLYVNGILVKTTASSRA